MKVIDTKLDGVKIIEPVVHGDQRGYFFESYNLSSFSGQGMDLNFVQDNQSKSSYGVLRGLHYQLEPYAQAKLVRVIKGAVLDVAVDINKKSPSFRKWVSVELTEDNFRQLLVPRGYAHGFVVLSTEAIVQYKCDNFYAPDYEAGIRYNDPELKIDWQISEKDIRVSGKDSVLPFLKEAL